MEAERCFIWAGSGLTCKAQKVCSDKRSSLFGLFMQKKTYKIDIMCQSYKNYLSMTVRTNKLECLSLANLLNLVQSLFYSSEAT